MNIHIYDNLSAPLGVVQERRRPKTNIKCFNDTVDTLCIH